MKCKQSKQHRVKTDSSNAKALRVEIIKCLDNKNTMRAEALKIRYHNKYGVSFDSLI